MNSTKRQVFGWGAINFICVNIVLCWGGLAQANPAYKLNIILDKMTYQAEPVKPHKTENDLWRRYVLYASFHVEGPAFDGQPVPCSVVFVQDPPERDDWDNVINPQWRGLVGDWYRMNVGGGVRSGLSLNTAILPSGGTFPCSVGFRPAEVGIVPSALDVAGLPQGGNVYTLRNPPLINEGTNAYDNWMAELLPPPGDKLTLIIRGVQIPGREVAIAFERDPSKSHMHSGNFMGTKWISHWFRGKEMIEGYARWPAF